MNDDKSLPVASTPTTDDIPLTRFGMLKKFGLLIRLFFVWIYARVVHEPTQVQDVLAVPKSESIVYILTTDNKHDFLFLNDLCLKMNMPLAYASNGKSHHKYATLATRISGWFKGRKKTFTPDELADLVAQHKPILIFLNQYGAKERKNRANTEAIFDAIQARVRQSPNLKVHYFPIGIIWERRTESTQISRFNEIFGTPTRPSSVRRFLSVLPTLGQLFFQIGKPLCLIHHQADFDEKNATSGAKIRTLFDEDIHTMHSMVNGPKVKPHQQLLTEIVESERFQNELKSISQQTGQSIESLTLEARKILDKTASKFSLLVCKLFTTALMPMWSIIYNGLYVDQEQFNRIRELSKTHRLVFIPSHKSHVDYLVLSILLFQNGVLPPLIAAGENLNFFPIGGILRRGGAFFIRRSFRGEQLYTACIRYYIDFVMHEGYPIEFFIEGGRSRTGQVLQPKFGILRMIAQTVQNDPRLPVKIIPCAITYEKVIEDMAYKNEQDGATKQKENFSNLIRTTKLLISKYGQIYVSFADPIDLNKALHIDDPCHEQNDQSLTADIDTMTVELMQRINQASTITMSALLSCALLNTPNDTMALDALLQNAAFLLSLLIERGALISPVLQTALAASRATLREAMPNPENDKNMTSHIKAQALVEPLKNPILQTLKLFEHNGAIKHRGNEFAPDIVISDSGRLQMAFYKNILLYAIIDDIYLACATLIHQNSKISKISECFTKIASIFSIEFADDDTPIRFEKKLNRFKERGWIQIENDSLTIVPQHKNDFARLANCMAHHIESYRFVFNAIDQKNATPQSEFDLIAELLLQAKNDIAAKRILPESRSKVIYSHAIQRLQKMEILTVSYEQTAKKSAKYLTKVSAIPSEILDCLKALTF